MDMYSVVKENPILAILRNIPLEYTVDYAQAIVDGGISFFEVALNSEHGLKQIAILRDRFGEKCMIGAGTAISVDLAKAAIGAVMRKKRHYVIAWGVYTWRCCNKFGIWL